MSRRKAVTFYIPTGGGDPPIGNVAGGVGSSGRGEKLLHST